MTWQRASLHVMIFPDMSDCFVTSHKSLSSVRVVSQKIRCNGNFLKIIFSITFRHVNFASFFGSDPKVLGPKLRNGSLDYPLL